MAKKPQPYLGVYGNMEFPDYVFHEYPKVVGYRDERKLHPIIVGDAKEELKFISEGAPGAHKTAEDELADQLNAKNLELEQAKAALEEHRKLREELAAKDAELQELRKALSPAAKPPEAKPTSASSVDAPIAKRA